MPKNVIITDVATLGAVPLPTHGGKYTPVGHQFIIDEVQKKLAENNLVVEHVEYKQNLNGEVAQGIYHLTHGSDPEIGLMFAWGNSYDKSMKFRCGIGAHVKSTGAGMFAGDMSNYGRKHMGDAKAEVVNHITDHIDSAGSYYNQLVLDRDAMKDVVLSNRELSAIMGRLYFEDEIITSSQLILIKGAHKSYKHMADANSLWRIYNHIIEALKKAHPKTWMEQQKDLHKVAMEYVVTNEIADLTGIVVEPGETLNAKDTQDVLIEVANEVMEEVLGNEVDAMTPISFDLDAYESKDVIIDESDPVMEGGMDAVLGTHNAIVKGTPLEGKESPPHLEESIVLGEALGFDPEAVQAVDFPQPPEDLPVEIEEMSEHDEKVEDLIEQTHIVNEEIKDVIESETGEIIPIPLEDQVAFETSQPVSEAEKEVSAEPIVDKPEIVQTEIVQAEVALHFPENLKGANAENDEESPFKF